MQKREKSKKAMEMTFGTIVVIVLAILLLIALIIVFNKSSGSFNDTINNWLSKSNVDKVVENCNSLSSLNSQYEFCCVKKDIILAKGEKLQASCFESTNKSWGSGISKISCEGVC